MYSSLKTCITLDIHAASSVWFRSLFSFVSPIDRTKEYTAKKLVGYSPEQMYDIVSDIEHYKKFLPFCHKSDILLRREDYLEGSLEIGFPPLAESYISQVTLKRPEYVKAEAKECCRIFDHMITIWKFEQGIKDMPNTSLVAFYLNFRFKSVIHAKMINVVFHELVVQMENAFLKEARRRHGKPALKTQTLQIISK